MSFKNVRYGPQKSLSKHVNPSSFKVTSVLVSLIKHLYFMRLEIRASRQQTIRVTCTVLVAGYLYIWVTQSCVRIRVGACRVSDVNVVSATECWAVTVVTIYGMAVSFYVKVKWFQSIMIFKREDETVGWICVGTAGVWNKNVLN